MSMHCSEVSPYLSVRRLFTACCDMWHLTKYLESSCQGRLWHMTEHPVEMVQYFKLAVSIVFIPIGKPMTGRHLGDCQVTGTTFRYSGCSSRNGRLPDLLVTTAFRYHFGSSDGGLIEAKSRSRLRCSSIAFNNFERLVHLILVKCSDAIFIRFDVRLWPADYSRIHHKIKYVPVGVPGKLAKSHSLVVC
jgi:hypothetical protein